MKKILLLLLLATFSIQAQTLQNPTFGNVKLKNNTTDNSATKVNVQSTDGTINTISKSDLVNVVEVNDVPSLPLVGEVGKIYVVKNINKIYRWNGTFYQELAGSDISGKEDIANKQNSLSVDGTGVKFPTVDAVNSGLGLKVDYNLPAIVANSTSGFINKNSQPFIHNFYAGVNPLQGGTGNNLNVGVNSGNFNSDNFNYASTMVGFESGMSNKNGYSNVGIGYRNLHLNQNGFGNSALGTYVLGNLTSGTQNTAIGWHSMLYSTTASENTAIGVEALWDNLVGLRNTALGMRAGASNIGNDNVFIGYNAGSSELGSNNLYIANKDRTLIGGNFLSGTLYFDSNQNDFLTGSHSKIRISGSGSESKISFLDRSNSFQNAFFDAFDYRFRMSGVDKIVFSDSGVITATSYTGSATLTGTPTAPTAPPGTNTTQVATTAFVTTADSQNVKLTGNQTISGQKSFSLTGKIDMQTNNGFPAITATALGSSNGQIAAQFINNSSSPYSSALRLQTNPSAGGVGNITLDVSNQSSIGTGIFSNASSGGVSISSQSGNGDSYISNITLGGTGRNYVGRNNGTETYSVDKTGSVTATQYKISALNTAPASATATGTLGEIRITSGFIYICIATNTWVRAALTTWI